MNSKPHEAFKPLYTTRVAVAGGGFARGRASGQARSADGMLSQELPARRHLLDPERITVEATVVIPLTAAMNCTPISSCPGPESRASRQPRCSLRRPRCARTRR
ncbi:hypothetical protein [Nonomuraea dietziae]|uniref:hypothetical protein n=1 Tax=Nonomuraea dietziae TaxID=65515 RepID=UPI003438F045